MSQCDRKEERCQLLSARLTLSRSRRRARADGSKLTTHGFITDKQQLETVLGQSQCDWFERLTEGKLESRPRPHCMLDSPCATPTTSKLSSRPHPHSVSHSPCATPTTSKLSSRPHPHSVLHSPCATPSISQLSSTPHPPGMLDSPCATPTFSRLSLKPRLQGTLDSPCATPTISQLINVSGLRVGSSPAFNYDSPVRFSSHYRQSPVHTPDHWSDWQKPLLGLSPSPRQPAFSRRLSHPISATVQSLGDRADESALSWTNSLATPPRDISDLSTDQSVLESNHKDPVRALFSPSDKLNTTGDSVVPLDSTYEDDQSADRDSVVPLDSTYEDDQSADQQSDLSMEEETDPGPRSADILTVSSGTHHSADGTGGRVVVDSVSGFAELSCESELEEIITSDLKGDAETEKQKSKHQINSEEKAKLGEDSSHKHEKFGTSNTIGSNTSDDINMDKENTRSKIIVENNEMEASSSDKIEVSPTFTQKCSRKCFKGNKSGTTKRRSRLHQLSVDSFLSDLFDTPASATRRRREKLTPDASCSDDSYSSPVLGKTLAGAVRCSTPKERAIQSILSSSQKKKDSSSSKKVSFSENVKKYTISSNYSPPLKKKGKTATRSKPEKKKVEFEEVIFTYKETKEGKGGDVNSSGEHSSAQKERKDIAIDETGDSKKVQLTSTNQGARLHSKGTPNNKSDSSSVSSIKERNNLQKIVNCNSVEDEKTADTFGDEFSQISPTALNEMCSVAEQSECISGEIDRQNGSLLGGDSVKEGKDTSGPGERDSQEKIQSMSPINKRQGFLKFMYPSASHSSPSAQKNIFKYEENSQTVRQEGLVRPVLPSYIVTKTDSMDKPDKETDMITIEKKETKDSESAGKIHVRRIVETDTDLSYTRVVKMDTEVDRKGRLCEISETDLDLPKVSSSNEEELRKDEAVNKIASNPVQGFQSASGKSLMLSAESLEQACKLLSEENCDIKVRPVASIDASEDLSKSSAKSTAQIREECTEYNEKEITNIVDEWSEDFDESAESGFDPDPSENVLEKHDTIRDIKHNKESVDRMEEPVRDKQKEKEDKMFPIQEKSLGKNSTSKNTTMPSLQTEASLNKIKNTSLDCSAELGGFKTASGKRLECSEEALRKAERQITEDKEVTTVHKQLVSMNTGPDRVAELSGSSGFKTASGKILECSEEALRKAEKQITEDKDVTTVHKQPVSINTGPDRVAELGGFSGFKTASGKKLECSEEALRKAEKQITEDKDETSVHKQTLSKVSTTPAKNVKLLLDQQEHQGKVSAQEMVIRKKDCFDKAATERTLPQAVENLVRAVTGFSTAGGSGAVTGFSTAGGSASTGFSTAGGSGAVTGFSTAGGSASTGFSTAGGSGAVTGFSTAGGSASTGFSTAGGSGAVTGFSTAGGSGAVTGFSTAGGSGAVTGFSTAGGSGASTGFSTAGGRQLKLSDDNVRKAKSVLGDIMEENSGQCSMEAVPAPSKSVKDQKLSVADRLRLEFQSDSLSDSGNYDSVAEELAKLKSKRAIDSQKETKSEAVSLQAASSVKAAPKSLKNVPQGFRPFKPPRPNVNKISKTATKYPESRSSDWSGTKQDNEETKIDERDPYQKREILANMKEPVDEIKRPKETLKVANKLTGKTNTNNSNENELYQGLSQVFSEELDAAFEETNVHYKTDKPVCSDTHVTKPAQVESRNVSNIGMGFTSASGKSFSLKESSVLSAQKLFADTEDSMDIGTKGNTLSDKSEHGNTSIDQGRVNTDNRISKAYVTDSYKTVTFSEIVTDPSPSDGSVIVSEIVTDSGMQKSNTSDNISFELPSKLETMVKETAALKDGCPVVLTSYCKSSLNTSIASLENDSVGRQEQMDDKTENELLSSVDLSNSGKKNNLQMIPEERSSPFEKMIDFQSGHFNDGIGNNDVSEYIFSDNMTKTGALVSGIEQCGFQTASGKRLKLSENAVANAQQMLNDDTDNTTGVHGVNDLKLKDSSDVDNVKNKSCILDIKLLDTCNASSVCDKPVFAETDKSTDKGCDMTLNMFQTAGGKRVNISEHALTTAKRKLDVDGVSVDSMNCDSKDLKSYSSEDDHSISARKKRRSDQSGDIEILNLKAKITDDEETTKTCHVTSEPEDINVADGKSVPGKVQFFQTASGKKVNVSEQSLNFAKKKLADETDVLHSEKSTDSENSKSDSVSTNVIIPGNKLSKEKKDNNNFDKPLGGFTNTFQTASGNLVNVSEKAVAVARDRLKNIDDNKRELTSMNAFQTASGGKVKISEKSLAFARRTLDDINEEESSSKSLTETDLRGQSVVSEGKEIENTSESRKEISSANPFQTASGRNVKVSEKALDFARKALDETCDSRKEFSCGNPFKTAAGGQVKVSEKALAIAKSTLEEACKNDTSLDGISELPTSIDRKLSNSAKRKSVVEDKRNIRPGFIHSNPFQTASGGAVKVSEKALQFARKTLSDTDVDIEMSENGGSECIDAAVRNNIDGDSKGLQKISGTNPFQTASGSSVKVSEKALNFARKTLIEAGSESSHNESFGPFQSASGKSVKVSEKALALARNMVSEENKDVLKPNMPDTANLSTKEAENNENSLRKEIPTADSITSDNDIDDCGNRNSIDEELMKLRSVKDKMQKARSGNNTNKTDASDGKNTTEAVDGHPVKRQKLEDGMEKTFEAMFDRASLKRKPIRTRPEGMTTDRRHPGYRPFIPVRSKMQQQPAQILDSMLQCGAATNEAKKDVTPGKPTFHTPYRTSVAPAAPSAMATADKVKVTMPIFRNSLTRVGENAQVAFSSGSSDNGNIAKHPRSADRSARVSVDNIDSKDTNVTETCLEVARDDMHSEYTENTKATHAGDISAQLGPDSVKVSCEDNSTEDDDQDKAMVKGLGNDKAVDDLDADLGSFSQEEEDLFYCLLVEARRQQGEIIQNKSRVKPMVGRLYQAKQTEGRWQLRDLVCRQRSGCTRPAVCSASAAEYRFCLDDHYTKHTAHLLVGDGAFLVPDDSGHAGTAQFYRAFLTLSGVDPKLTSEAWLVNHYKWTVWKLAAYEACMPDLAGRCLTPEMVMLQLKYRYDREVDLAQRSAIRKIFEKDDAPSKRLVLCVAGIRLVSDGSSVDLAGSSTSNPDAKVILELTDGWYSIRAPADVPLTDLVHRGRLWVGQKICITGAELVGGEDACSPLEAPESVMLKFSCNSARPSPWDSPLGYQPDPRPLCVPLSSLYGEGGAVGIVDVVIVRKYPTMYMEKLPGGGSVFRTGRCEERVRQESESRKEVDMQRMYRDLEAEADKENRQVGRKKPSRGNRKWATSEVEGLTTGQEIYEGMNTAQQPDTFQSYLSERQLGLLYEYQRQLQEEKLAELNSRFQAAWQDRQESAPDRNVTPMIKFRVSGCSRKDMDSHTSTILTVWRPAAEISDLQEGKRYKIYSLNASTARSKYTGHRVQLTATKQTKFMSMSLDENFLDNIYEPREVLWVSDVVRRRPAYGELDFVGLVVKVTAASSADSGKPCDAVHMADCQGRLLSIKFWNGFKSFGEDLFAAGSVLCCCNLMDKAAYRSPHLPTVEAATESTLFSRKPQTPGQRKALERLNSTLQGNKGFLESTQAALDSLQSGIPPASEFHQMSTMTTPNRIHKKPSPGSITAGSESCTTSPGAIKTDGTLYKTPEKLTESPSDQTNLESDLTGSSDQPHASNQPGTSNIESTENSCLSTPQSEPVRAKKSIYQAKMARLLSYSSPGTLSPMNTPTTRGVRKGFKPPAFKKS